MKVIIKLKKNIEQGNNVYRHVISIKLCKIPATLYTQLFIKNKITKKVVDFNKEKYSNTRNAYNKLQFPFNRVNNGHLIKQQKTDFLIIIFFEKQNKPIQGRQEVVRPVVIYNKVSNQG